MGNIEKSELDMKTNPLSFDYRNRERYWLEKWEKDDVYRCDETTDKPKSYVLDMFPYPSGAGLHVGHVEGYTATDIVSRYRRMKGYEVLHPMGWDSFGLPTENYAIKTGKNPTEVTRENTNIFKSQCIKAGLSFNWEREIDTSSPEYYRWTQWLFLKLYSKNLAYKAEAPVNWCPSCMTVIANEQVISGKCERCESSVETKKIDQWFFKTTAYAKKLLEGLDKVDWPDSTKVAQKNWIGESSGYEISFPVVGKNEEIKVFTTRPGTIHGATFIAVAPESEEAKLFAVDENKRYVDEYVKNITPQSEIERKKASRGKTGVFTGSYAINPISGEKIPIWVSDYVIMDYGTGAIMGVPALDQRDKEFANTFKLKIADVSEELLTPEAVGSTISELGKSAQSKTQFKLRDWLVSRERYWGSPIPIVYCEECGMQPVPEEELPVLLPQDIIDYKPTGVPPLAKSKSFMEATCPNCAGKALREAKTLDTFVDSSWYFMRFCDPTNSKEFADSKALKKWMPVDLYVGGSEHIAGHLLYSRFITKVLHEEGLIDFEEPFTKLVHPGIILGEDRRKMSKRWGNVIRPDDVIEKYGADTLRMYEMFMGPLDLSKPWSSKSIIGVKRFVDRVYSSVNMINYESKTDPQVEDMTDQLIENIEKYMDSLKLNLAISDFMKYLTNVESNGSVDRKSYERFLLALSPFAPFISEDIWARLGNKFSIHQQSWPQVEGKNLKETNPSIALQLNGKFKGMISVAAEFSGTEQEIRSLLEHEEKFNHLLSDKQIKNIIFKPGKIINIVF